ncbi:efflux transporter outer membrane subunit [Sphingomicrobium sp. XHP0239]|uniref:efflux transporter outer membrane subunit n=1 Tax=Sphingomicrobium maritimum TaxID=3133972 RepID=UPI0031CC88E2
MMRASLAAPLVALALSGCNAGPDTVPTVSDVAVPDSFLLAPEAAPADAAAVAALLPDDPAFDTLAAAALADAPTLAQALARIDVARSGADRAGARRLPDIGYDATLTASRTNLNLPPEVPFDTEQVQYAGNLVAGWDPDLFGALRNAERAALLRVDAAGAQAAAVRLALLADIAGAVTDWRTLGARQQALEADRDGAQRLADLSRTREEAGIAPGFDRFRAEAQAAQSISRLAALDRERADLLGRLVALTALPAGEVAAALAQSSPPDTLAPPPPALPSTLIAARPDIQAAALTLAAADADLAAVAARRFPRLDLSGALGLLAFSVGGLFDTDALVGSARSGLTGPLLDFGRIAAEIDEGEARTVLAFEEYRGAVFGAFGEVEGAYALVAAADAEAAATRREAEMATRAATLADTRYRAGLENFLTVLEARRAADTSGDRAAAARGRAVRARILLWQALGGSAPADVES